MEAAWRCGRIEGRINRDGAGVRRCATIYTGFVRDISRNETRAWGQESGAAMAVSSAFVSDIGEFSGARFSKGAHQFDRGFSGKESRELEVAAIWPRSVRMGQIVH